jgi:hypothetical protein
MDRQPSPALHIHETIKKVRRRYWIIRHLKRYGLSESELVKVYTSILRATIEFTSVVYGTMLTREQSEDLEHAQSQALKIIFGFNHSYREVLGLAGVERLDERRRKAIEKFAAKSYEGKFRHWFPLNENRKTRNSLKFKEENARTDRMRNTPIFYMRRVLNELQS